MDTVRDNQMPNNSKYNHLRSRTKLRQCIGALGILMLSCAIAHAQTEPAGPSLVPDSEAFEIAEAHLNQATTLVMSLARGSQTSREKIDRILAALDAELENPAPNVGGSDPWANQSESVQMIYMRALADVGSVSDLMEAAANQTNRQLRRRIIISIAYTDLATSDTEKASVISDLLVILTTDPDDFLRAQAADALGRIAPPNNSVKAQMIAALKEALKDPAVRMGKVPSGGSTLEVPAHIVQRNAAGALWHLGVNVRGNPHTSYLILNENDPNTTWISARPFLQDQGYSVQWDGAEKRLDATRKSTVVHLWAGRREAEINGRMIPLSATPQIVNTTLRIPDTLQTVLANGGSAAP